MGGCLYFGGTCTGCRFPCRARMRMRMFGHGRFFVFWWNRHEVSILSSNRDEDEDVWWNRFFLFWWNRHTCEVFCSLVEPARGMRMRMFGGTSTGCRFPCRTEMRMRMFGGTSTGCRFPCRTEMRMRMICRPFNSR
ncbi:hypothetical protein AMTR_s00106p00038480 [Amborella trichopoda]|uniref:Uncharacterized protein n=1 Tax=Amborella trichopoda TaxID=13333 RepID=W1NZF6_AMBTC|nr:hypothetical protein AMTR_s00106p00038480 [Amborella trichopoda]